jgi:hypothetical protein
MLAARAASLKQAGEEPPRSLQLREEIHHLVSREHGRHARGTCYPLHVLQPRQLTAEHFFVQEQQRRKRLILRAGGDLPVKREVVQKGGDLCLSKLGRVAFSSKANEPFDPMNVRLFRAATVIAGRIASCTCVSSRGYSPAFGPLDGFEESCISCRVAAYRNTGAATPLYFAAVLALQ